MTYKQELIASMNEGMLLAQVKYLLDASGNKTPDTINGFIEFLDNTEEGRIVLKNIKTQAFNGGNNV